MEIRDPNAAPKKDLVAIVQALQEYLYLKDDPGQDPSWDRDKPVDVEDLAATVGELLDAHGLAPYSEKEWTPRRHR